MSKRSLFSAASLWHCACSSVRRLLIVGFVSFIISACYISASDPVAAPPSVPVVETWQLPPTWTATARMAVMETVSPTLHPSATFAGTSIPLPSLTPYNGVVSYIGYSVEGRPLQVVRFGNGERRRMIIAGMHGGNEWNTIVLAEEIIAYLQQNPHFVPIDVTLFILPSLNPDGEARAHTADGRVNSNGVDLNRNFDADWRADWPRQGCWTLRPATAGPYPASEPETLAVMTFLLAHPVDALINYHSAALGIFPAGDPPDARSARLAQAIDDVSPYPYPPIDTGCVFSGTLVDWAAGLGIAAVDLELRNHTDTDFDINLRVLEVLLNWQP